MQVLGKTNARAAPSRAWGMCTVCIVRTHMQVLGKTTRALHQAVPPDADRSISNAEAEADRQALYNENVQWAGRLKDDETLRQPTRTWYMIRGNPITLTLSP